MSNELRVTVKSLAPTPTGCGVFLGNGDEKVIAIFVDHSAAAAITMFMHHVKKPRPLTHDFIANILTGLDIKVEKMVINDLKDDTFFARIFLHQENELGRKIVEIDARPSDSIAMALQQKCPIFVNREVWNQAENMIWAFEEASSGMEDEDDLGEEEEG
ncbi:MAG: bifunctional nuclease family protein [Kiritimatiellae bacterium]|nr:bifunctional nuclease family protein [Kiritimatiellia bacterium]